MNSTIKGNVNGNHEKSKERSDLGKISSLRTRIESLLVKTQSLEIKTRSFFAYEAKFQTKREKKITKEYSLKDRSLPDKTQSLPFYNSFSKILKIGVHGQLYQDSILDF